MFIKRVVEDIRCVIEGNRATLEGKVMAGETLNVCVLNAGVTGG
jgi:hypothetical protein